MKAHICKAIFYFVTLISFQVLKAQSIQRQTISSSGTSSANGQQIIRQTIGQPYQTHATYNNEVSYRPGFQQPIFRMESLESSFSLNVYPNPSSFFLNISSITPLDNVKISIHDGLGKVVYETELSNFTKHQVACNSWANGAYFLKVINNDKIFSSQIILYR